MWWDPATGKRRRVWAFSIVLSVSRYLFVWPTVRMDQQAWVDERAAGSAPVAGEVAR